MLAIEKYVKDIIQCQKVQPDLVESIMEPTRPAKEALHRILIRMDQFRPEVK